MILMVTVGHNSSAGLFAPTGECICAYEEERLSKVKADSSFPKLAITECLKYADKSDIDYIFISNWFTNKISNKYVDEKFLKTICNTIIYSEEKGVSHHLNHAYSVWNFSGTTDGLTIVADGFGNNEEVISIYKDGTLVEKVYGYENSLGLMYQYATSAAGLKENQDEYKLLGYEISSDTTDLLIKMPNQDFNIQSSDELINYAKLRKVKKYWYKEFSKFRIRANIAHQAQMLLEHEINKILDKYNPTFVQLSGGVFYNVKLNNMILRKVDKLCINPVCGDQGNIFGLPGLNFDNLYLGKRVIKHKYPNPDKEITEVFIGDMEFGPRALCHTSTLATPTKHNVEVINTYNNRDTVMPMAPVVTREFFNENFKDTNKIIKSEKYMICAFDFKEIKEEYKGAAHYDPWRDVYTGRVQVLDKDDELYEFVKDRGGILINTSLNYHGQPILFDNTDYEQYQKLIKG